MDMKDQSGLARTSAIFGALAWGILVFIRTSQSTETELINKILLLGILVIVPLGLSLVATPDRHGRHSFGYKLAVFVQPLGAVTGVASVFIEPGVLAAVLPLGWLFVTVLTALFGFWGFFTPRFPPPG